MKGFTQFYEKMNVEFLNISEKCVLNKKNWIIEIKKKFKNYINNFSWFLLHAENP